MLVFMVIVFNKIIINPLKGVVVTTTAIAGGDYSHNLQVNQKDEVGLLAEGVNRMLHNIRLREAERDGGNSS